MSCARRDTLFDAQLNINMSPLDLLKYSRTYSALNEVCNGSILLRYFATDSTNDRFIFMDGKYNDYILKIQFCIEREEIFIELKHNSICVMSCVIQKSSVEKFWYDPRPSIGYKTTDDMAEFFTEICKSLDSK